MLARLLVLVRLQMGKEKQKRSLFVRTLFSITSALLIGGIAYVILYAMEKFIYLKATNSMALFVIFISSVLTIIGDTLLLGNFLYRGKDNQFLLALPVYNNEIFLSKLIVFYLKNLKSNLMTLFPILIGYGIYSKQGAIFFIFAFISTFILPLISVLISSLLSIIVTFVSNALKKYSFLYGILILLIIGVVFYFVIVLLKNIPVPFRLIALYNAVINGLLTFIESANKYALFYSWFSNMLFNNNALIYLLMIIALVILLALLNIFISKPIFFKMASKSQEISRDKVHITKNKKSKNIFFAFYNKEIKLSSRQLGKLFNDYILVLVMPIILYIVNKIFYAIQLVGLGETLAFATNIIIGIAILTSSNANSASSLSEEGAEFVLLKSSPGDTRMIAWAKILNNIIVSTIIMIISLIVLGITKVLPLDMLILLGFLYFIVNSGHILWSFQLDINNPKIRNVASTGTITDKSNITKSLTIGLILAFVFGALLGLTFYDKSNMSFFYSMFYASIFFIWRFVVFRLTLKVHFSKIEL